MKKKILLLLLAIVVIGGGYLYFNFNSIVLRTTEKVATNALGVKVTIDDFNLALTDKRVTVSGIRIANPEGYKGPYIMEIGSVDVGLNTANKSLIDFKNIDVNDSVVNVEINQKGMNVLDLKKKLASGSSEKAVEPSEATAKEAIKVIVERAAINATTINTNVTFLERDIASITMPSVTFRDIGKNDDTSAGDAMKQIFSKYMAAVQNQVSKNGGLSGVDIPGLTSSLGESIKDTTEDVKNKIKGLFN